MTEQTTCNRCKKQVYLFTGKTSGKRYYCDSDKYNDFHKCTENKPEEKQQKLPEPLSTDIHTTLLDIHTIAVATRKRFYPESDNWDEVTKRIADMHYENVITQLMKSK